MAYEPILLARINKPDSHKLAGYRADGDKCVKITCRAGYELGDDGTCRVWCAETGLPVSPMPIWTCLVCSAAAKAR